MVKKLSIIIPVYNEESTIRAILGKVRDVELVEGIEKEVIVIDDASSDTSGSEIKEFLDDHLGKEYRLISHPTNKGKGAGIRTGLEHATGDYIIIQDADLELNPNEYNDLLQPVIKGEADVVYGSRFLDKTRSVSESWIHRMANGFLTWLSNFVFKTRLTDMETCYKLMPADAIKNVRLDEDRFGFEPEITAKLARTRGIRFKEVPITYEARTSTEGKKIGWSDGFRAIWCILKYGWFVSRKRAFIDPEKARSPRR